MTDQTIEQLAREIAAEAHTESTIQPDILHGHHDYSPAVKAARLALLEGERRGMEKAAGIAENFQYWLGSLDAADAQTKKLIAAEIRRITP